MFPDALLFMYIVSRLNTRTTFYLIR